MIVVLGACQRLGRGAGAANSDTAVEGPGAASTGMGHSVDHDVARQEGRGSSS